MRDRPIGGFVLRHGNGEIKGRKRAHKTSSGDVAWTGGRGCRKKEGTTRPKISRRGEDEVRFSSTGSSSTGEGGAKREWVRALGRRDLEEDKYFIQIEAARIKRRSLSGERKKVA